MTVFDKCYISNTRVYRSEFKRSANQKLIFTYEISLMNFHFGLFDFDPITFFYFALLHFNIT